MAAGGPLGLAGGGGDEQRAPSAGGGGARSSPPPSGGLGGPGAPSALAACSSPGDVPAVPGSNARLSNRATTSTCASISARAPPGLPLHTPLPAAGSARAPAGWGCLGAVRGEGACVG